MKPASLFIGRWAPFHEGHQALIESVLVTGKPVVIAIRDTEPSKDNPYSTSERWSRIQEALHKWGNLVRIIVIPDIDEVCYGREVGYGIRKIDLDEEIHAISGTKKRISDQVSHPIVWLTGQSGSGKTTLAVATKNLAGEVVILDGDDMRESISGEGFSQQDRHAHNLRVARLAQVLARQAPVIVAVIAPFSTTRREIDQLIAPRWVLCQRRTQKEGSEFPYEVPDNTEVDMVVDNDAGTLAENAATVVGILRDRRKP
jgi:hypothetical protein